MWKNRYSNDNWFVYHDTKPPYDGEYNVTVRGAIRATTLTYEDGKWTDINGTEFDVVAWTFLPGAYVPRR